MASESLTIAPEPSVLRLGALALVPAARRASLRGSDLDLSATEFALLWTLAISHDTDVSAGTLLRAAGWRESSAARIYLDLYIRYLRQKLGDDPERPSAITSVRRGVFVLNACALNPPSVPSSPPDLLSVGAQ